MRGGRVIPWTTSEYACILNWIDYCHINKLDYRETVVQKLQGQSSREVNIRKIQDRLRFVWGKYGGHSKFSYDDLLTTGVTYYHVSKFPVELTTQMNDERKILGMPLLKIKRTPKDIEHKTDEMPYIMGTPGPQSSSTLSHDITHAYRMPGPVQSRCAEPLPLLPEGEPMNHQVRPTTSAEGANLSHYQHDHMFISSSFEDWNRTSVNDNIQFASTSRPVRFVPQQSQFGPAPATRMNRPRPTPSPITVTTPLDAAEFVPTADTNNNDQAISPANQALMVRSYAEPKSLNDMVCWLLKRLELGGDIAIEDCKRLTSIHRTIQEPGEVLKKLIEDLFGLDRERRRYRAFIENLIGDHSLLERIDNPGYPSESSLNTQWNKLREGIKYTVGNDCRGSLPLTRTLHHLAILTDLFVSGKMGEEPLKNWAMPILGGHHASSCVVQSYMTALVVRWLFACPRTTPSQDHCEKIVKLYEMIYTSEGIAAVKRIDLIVTKMLHQDESLQTQVIARETKSLIDLIKKESFRSMPPIQIGDFDDISSWVEDAVKLKQALMVSSKEYTIQFCSSGVDFDHSWMRAEDENGRHLSESECIFAKVKLCLFPAIAQYSTPVLAQGCDISAVLASRKPFFKKREPNTVEIISKAVVLVENEISQSGADFSGIPMEY